MVGGDDTMVAGSKWHNGQQWDYGAHGQGMAAVCWVAGCTMGCNAVQCTVAILVLDLRMPWVGRRRCSRQTAPPVPALCCAVFDVDAEEGAPPRKLALNCGDNPYLVADRWLEEQGLPTSYK